MGAYGESAPLSFWDVTDTAELCLTPTQAVASLVGLDLRWASLASAACSLVLGLDTIHLSLGCGLSASFHVDALMCHSRLESPSAAPAPSSRGSSAEGETAGVITAQNCDQCLPPTQRPSPSTGPGVSPSTSPIPCSILSSLCLSPPCCHLHR